MQVPGADLHPLVATALDVLCPDGAASKPTGQTLLCSLTITGELSVTLTLRCDVAHARDLAAGLLGVPVAEVSHGDAADALGELANTIAGLIKPLYQGEHVIGFPQRRGQASTVLGMPTVIAGFGTGTLELWVDATDLGVTASRTQ